MTTPPHRAPRLVAAGRAVGVDRAVAPIESSSDTWLRTTLFLAVFAYFWIGFSTFEDLADPSVLLLETEGNALRQVMTLGLVAVVGLFAVMRQRDMLPVLITPILVAVVCWLLLSAALSADPGLSARRVILAVLMTTLSAVFPLLASSERQFTLLLSIALIGFLVLNFGGVLLVPKLAIHQPWDLKEANLAGGWRGAFQHKNAAGSAMAVAMLLGVYIARARNMTLGLAIAIASAVFLVFTRSKTPVLFIVPSLGLAWLILRMRGTFARVVLLLSVLGLVNLFTLGTVLFPPVKAIVEKSVSDPTFTNRTDIWEFATREVMKHPIKGHGFAAFWRTNDIANGGDSIETWATKAGHGHNGYLDSVINSGFPALALMLLWLVAYPMRDLRIAESRGAAGPLVTLYVQIIVFGLLMSCLESLFFAPDGPIWFMMLLAVFGLRLQAGADLVADEPRDALRGAAV